MKRLFFVACSIAFGLASCSLVPAEIENVVAYTRVGDLNHRDYRQQSPLALGTEGRGF